MQGDTGHSLSVSEVAQRKRVEKDLNIQWETFHMQLEQVEKKNQDLIKSRKKLSEELDKKARECKFFEKQCQEQQKELQSIRSQLETTTKINGLGSKGKALHAMGVTSYQDAKNINQALDQLKNAKDQNEHLRAELAAAVQDNQDKALRVKVLEDALAFRSEEIGLAGHADLLAKVAQLKGEVRALKDELSDKSQRISLIQDDKSRLSNEHETLQQQIAGIQQRLAQSQQEAYKYANTDLGILLKNAEQERDTLLDYIQQDMDKSATLGKQVEKLESEIRNLRRKGQSLEDEAEVLRKENTRRNEDLEQARKVEDNLKNDNKNLVAKVEQLQHHCESLQLQLGHKAREEDEIMKHQISLFAQLRGKDEELMRKTEEIITLRARVQECDISLPSLKNENIHVKDQNEHLEEEVVLYRKKAIELESENRALNSSVLRLDQENKDLQKRCHEQSEELQDLRPYKMLVDDLDSDLMDNGDTDSQDNSYSENSDILSPGTPFGNLQRSGNHVTFESSPRRTTVTAFTSSNKDDKEVSHNENDLIDQLTLKARSVTPSKTQKVESFISPAKDEKRQKNARSNQHLTLSQQHSLWIGLPSIRKLHPRLYEKIRKLAQDLHKKEVEHSDLQHRFEKLQAESTIDSKESEGRIAYLSMCHNSDQEKIASMTGKLHVLESENYGLKDAKTCLNQIRTVIAALSEHPLLTELNIGNDNEEETNIDGKRLYLHQLHALSLHQQDLSTIADTALPNLIQELLSANAQAVLTLKDVMGSYRRLDSEHKELTSQVQQLQKTNADQSHRLTFLEDDLVTKNRKLQTSEVDVQQQLDIAAELAEKQNALMMSLEAKIESLHREKQLKNAQISAIQQREDALRGRVLSHLERENRRIPVHNPTLSDLVQLLLEPSQHPRQDRNPYDYHQTVDYAHERPRPASHANAYPQDYDGHQRMKYSDISPHSSRDIRSEGQSYDGNRKRSGSPQYSREEPAIRTSSRDSYGPPGGTTSRSSSRGRASSSSAPSYHRQHPPNDGEIISSMADREARSIAARTIVPEHNLEPSRRDDIRVSGYGNNSSSLSSLSQSHGPSVAAQALQDRIKKAQQTFRAMRDSSSKHQ